MIYRESAVLEADGLWETEGTTRVIREADRDVWEELCQDRVPDVEWHGPDFELHVGGLS